VSARIDDGAENRIAREIYGASSTCYWIESTGMEDAPMLGPLRGDITADVVIIGGGYTGLATALYLTESFPQKQVVILEAARIGYGASGRNDGFVQPLIHGAEDIIERLVEDGQFEAAREIYGATSAGIGIIEDVIEKYEIVCEWEKRTSLVAAATESQVSRLEQEQRHNDLMGLETELLTSAELRRYVNIEGYKAAITVPMGGMLNPAKLARGMISGLQSKGVTICEGIPATRIVPGKKVTVQTPAGSVTAGAVVLATNAYTSRLGFFRGRVLPVHAYNIVTEPLTEKQIEALNWQDRSPINDVRNFFDLFRLTADNRIVQSGGDGFYRYGDGLGEGENLPDCDRLERNLFVRFPMLEGLRVTHRWCGHVGLTLDRIPTVGVTGAAKNIYYGLGYSGHGVPVAFLAGKLICDLYSGNAIDPVYDFFINRKPPAAPPEPIRSIGFALYKRYLRWADSR
jgi:glycine/D-amino acid oxidase-like deaminating enzyme